MRRFFRALFSLKTLLRLSIGLAILVLVALFALLIDDLRGRRAWSQYEKDARARGLKIDLLEYVPQPVPEGENRAALPAIQRALAAGANGDEVENPYELPPARQSNTRQGLATGEKMALEPMRDAFVRAKKIAKASENPAADVLAALEHWRPALDELHQFLQRPHTRFPIDWENGYFARHEHLRIIIGAAQCLRLRAMARLDAGAPDEAWTDTDDLFRVTNMLDEQPDSLHGTVRLAVETMVPPVVWHGLADGRWSDEHLARLDPELARFDPIRDRIFVLDSERTAINRLFVLMHSGALKRLTAERNREYFVSTPISLVDIDLLEGWKRHSQVRINRHIEDLIARIDAERGMIDLQRPLPLSVKQMYADGSYLGHLKVRYFRLFSESALMLEFSEERALHSAMQFRLARIAVALERWRRARGAYPATLTDLVPAFLAAVPHEATSMDLPRYRPTEDGRYLLYSIGMDAKDDGGTPNTKRLQSSPSSHPDWPWPAPLK